jgi:hypothetical protein
VTVDNVVPTIAISGAATVDEGAPYSLTLGAISDPGTDTVTAWTVHWGDGSSDTYSAGGVVTHTYADGPDSHGITVDLLDEDGTHLDRANDLSVTVDNVAPTADGGADQTAAEGTAVSLAGTFTDPGNADTHTQTWSVSASNGQIVTGGSGADYSFTPNDNGTYTVSYTVTDDDGGTHTDTVIVTVANVAPSVDAAASQTANEGANTAFALGSFTDPGDDDPWVVTVDWGDASTDTTFSVNAAGSLGSQSHRYGDNGTYTVTVTLDEDNGAGADGSDTFQVGIANVAPTLTNPGFTYNPYTGSAAASVDVSDPGWRDTATSSFSWSGFLKVGSPGSIGPGAAPGPMTGAFVSTHSFGPGCITGAVTVTVTDDDGGTRTETLAAAGSLARYGVTWMAPVQDGMRNVVKHGNVIPLKIRVVDCLGRDVTNRTLTVGIVQGLVNISDVEDGTTLVTLTESVGSHTDGVMRVVDSRYQYNLATKPLKVGLPYTIVIRDGTQVVTTAVIEPKK